MSTDKDRNKDKEFEKPIVAPGGSSSKENDQENILLDVKGSLVSSLDKNLAFFKISLFSLIIATIAILVVFISIWTSSKPVYTQDNYQGFLTDSILMDTTNVSAIIQFEEEKMRAYYESRIAYRNDMIEMLKAVLLNFLLPILTAVIGYLAGINKSNDNNED